MSVNPGHPTILVTGASGFLGRRLVERLSKDGYRVRALVRKLSSVEALKKIGAEVHLGDVGDTESLRSAFSGVDVVIHAAADTSGREEEGQVSTIRGTRNIVDLCRSSEVKKLVYISSCSVYGIASCKDGTVIAEDAELETSPELRGHYSHAKLKAEQIVADEMRKGLPAVCLRPGTYFGPGGETYTPMMGMAAGEKVFLIIGNGSFVLPFIFIDNLIDAIILTIGKVASNGMTYNVVDPKGITKREYVDLFLRKLYPAAKFIYIPYALFYGLVYIQEILAKAFRIRPCLTRYRVATSQRKIVYNVSRLINDLGWRPPYTTEEGLWMVLEFERKKQRERCKY